MSDSYEGEHEVRPFILLVALAHQPGQQHAQQSLERVMLDARDCATIKE